MQLVDCSGLPGKF